MDYHMYMYTLLTHVHVPTSAIVQVEIPLPSGRIYIASHTWLYILDAQ